jgi:hypothetical protein
MQSARRPLLGNRSVNTPLQQYGEDIFSLWSVPSGYLEDIWGEVSGIEFSEFNPCGGWVEYLHRDPASRKRRRNWKSQI